MNYANRILGEDTTTGDVLPVIAHRPRYWSSKKDVTVNADKDKKEIHKDRAKARKGISSIASRIMGEAKENPYQPTIKDKNDDGESVSIFPEEKVEVEGGSYIKGAETVGKDNEDKNKVSNPYKGLISPANSLVAPNVTPDALEPLSPSDIPGDQPITVKKEPVGPVENPYDAADKGMQTNAMSAMDTLLGRGKFVNQDEMKRFSGAGQVEGGLNQTPTEESFKNVIGANAIYEDVAAATLNAGASSIIESTMTPGTPMPEHTDGKGQVFFNMRTMFGDDLK